MDKISSVVQDRQGESALHENKDFDESEFLKNVANELSIFENAS